MVRGSGSREGGLIDEFRVKGKHGGETNGKYGHPGDSCLDQLRDAFQSPSCSRLFKKKEDTRSKAYFQEYLMLRVFEYLITTLGLYCGLYLQKASYVLRTYHLEHQPSSSLNSHAICYGTHRSLYQGDTVSMVGVS